MARTLGIDFGTSNSAVAVWTEKGAEPVALEDGRSVMPSAIFVRPDGDVLFGRAAFAAYVEGDEGRFMRGLKSLLGSPLLHERTFAGGRGRSFAEIVGLYLGELKRRADAATGEAADAVVMGRPVRFVDRDDAADARAERELEAIVRLQGFDHVAFEYEPVAAAFEHERRIAAPTLALVADIGGGTSDFSLIRLRPDAEDDRTGDILASAGVHVGGTDYDREISLAAAMPALGRGTMLKGGRMATRDLPMPNHPFVDLATWHRIPFLYTREAREKQQELLDAARRPDLFGRYRDIVEDHRGHELAIAVEDAKIAAVERGEARLDVCGHVEVPLAIATLAGTTDRLTQGVGEALDAVLREAGVAARDVQTLIWMGGGSLFSPLREALRARLPETSEVSDDLLGSVSRGLAIRADRARGRTCGHSDG